MFSFRAFADSGIKHHVIIISHGGSP